jgi:hypothetical protein
VTLTGGRCVCNVSPMLLPELIERLHSLDACDESLAWLQTLSAESTLADAWRTCPRADWLAWLLSEVNLARTSTMGETQRALVAQFGGELAPLLADLVADCTAPEAGRAELERARGEWSDALYNSTEEAVAGACMALHDRYETPAGWWLLDAIDNALAGRGAMEVDRKRADEIRRAIADAIRETTAPETIAQGLRQRALG